VTAKDVSVRVVKDDDAADVDCFLFDSSPADADGSVDDVTSSNPRLRL